MKPNPCRLCGGIPTADKWSNHFAVYCYNELGSHDCRVNGRTLAAAIELWNRWNPLPGAPARPNLISRILKRRPV